MTQMGMPIELIGELTLFGLRGLKGGRELESIVTDIIDQAKGDQQQPQMPQAGGMPANVAMMPPQGALPIA